MLRKWRQTMVSTSILCILRYKISAKYRPGYDLFVIYPPNITFTVWIACHSNVQIQSDKDLCNCPNLQFALHMNSTNSCSTFLTVFCYISVSTYSISIKLQMFDGIVIIESFCIYIFTSLGVV